MYYIKHAGLNHLKKFLRKYPLTDTEKLKVRELLKKMDLTNAVTCIAIKKG